MTIELYKNSFVTLDEAQVYFEERYDSDEWFNLTDDEKEKLLITSSKKINAFDFVGNTKSENQTMAFPRDYEMPQDIKDAVCEEAIATIKSSENMHIKNQKDNISSISLGAGSVSYGTTPQSEEAKLMNSSTAIYLIKKWTKKGYYIPF